MDTSVISQKTELHCTALLRSKASYQTELTLCNHKYENVALLSNAQHRLPLHHRLSRIPLRIGIGDWATCITKPYVDSRNRTWCLVCTLLPHTHYQNGVAKRTNRTLADMARALFIQSKLPHYLWEYAIRSAVYSNSFTVRPHFNTFERLYDHPPDISHLKTSASALW